MLELCVNVREEKLSEKMQWNVTIIIFSQLSEHIFNCQVVFRNWSSFFLPTFRQASGLHPFSPLARRTFCGFPCFSRENESETATNISQTFVCEVCNFNTLTRTFEGFWFLFLCSFNQVNLCSPTNNESYQERLLRLEGDKESLVLQVWPFSSADHFPCVRQLFSLKHQAKVHWEKFYKFPPNLWHF